jgi:hypothetical protein
MYFLQEEIMQAKTDIKTQILEILKFMIFFC